MLILGLHFSIIRTQISIWLKFLKRKDLNLYLCGLAPWFRHWLAVWSWTSYLMLLNLSACITTIKKYVYTYIIYSLYSKGSLNYYMKLIIIVVICFKTTYKNMLSAILTESSVKSNLSKFILRKRSSAGIQVHVHPIPGRVRFPPSNVTCNDQLWRWASLTGSRV